MHAGGDERLTKLMMICIVYMRIVVLAVVSTARPMPVTVIFFIFIFSSVFLVDPFILVLTSTVLDFARGFRNFDWPIVDPFTETVNMLACCGRVENLATIVPCQAGHGIVTRPEVIYDRLRTDIPELNVFILGCAGKQRWQWPKIVSTVSTRNADVDCSHGIPSG